MRAKERRGKEEERERDTLDVFLFVLLSHKQVFASLAKLMCLHFAKRLVVGCKVHLKATLLNVVFSAHTVRTYTRILLVKQKFHYHTK